MVIPDLGGIGNHVIARSRHLLTAHTKEALPGLDGFDEGSQHELV
jgi:hypothetical protein